MLGSTLLLAVTCLLINSAGSQKIRTVACEGSETQLKCDKGQLISVSRATYGRSDQKTCSSGRPANQLTNVQCSGNADKVAQSCNEKQSCSIQAANSVFGDPCVGTYKYLEVEHTCKAPESSSQEEGPTVACEGSMARLQCDKGQLISVSRATYGRSDQKTCSSGRPANQLTNVQCSGKADKVAQSCNGKQSCSIQAANSVFGDPCVGTYKYLEVEYTCKAPESSSQEDGPTVACEGSMARLQCDKGQLISVSRATYGRSDQKTCSSGRPANQLTNVQCSGKADKVAQSCNGKQSCSIQAANSVFGDPCFGTYKYLEVEYTCKAPKSSSQEDGPTVACEGSVARLQCDKGQLISVSRATYGRSDQKTCSSGRPANQLTNVQCSGNADKVAQSCNGKQSCSIQAANSVFGDPCVGTYKYLEVEYTCKAESSSQEDGPTVACEGSVARLQCDKGQLISVSRATYGRSDQKTCSSGRPANQLTNVQCSGNADKVAQRCNGRRKCRVRAANSMFGDPCVGTYKYLEVDYLCYASVTG